ncbi:unnamed protein product [Linum trigynum]|uniref:Uncharacterized protein n=1 Tax=Linum trigynum TaxID=586398 RepID=A0AAV2ETI3_9ROSI
MGFRPIPRSAVAHPIKNPDSIVFLANSIATAVAADFNPDISKTTIQAKNTREQSLLTEEDGPTSQTDLTAATPRLQNTVPPWPPPPSPLLVLVSIAHSCRRVGVRIVAGRRDLTTIVTGGRRRAHFQRVTNFSTIEGGRKPRCRGGGAALHR